MACCGTQQAISLAAILLILFLLLLVSLVFLLLLILVLVIHRNFLHFICTAYKTHE